MTAHFFCYLLRSKHEKYVDRSYVGFTVNPFRRIRQHNGEIKNGAWKTSRKRPWEMVCFVGGIPSKIQALQFEWAWQNPSSSKIIKAALPSVKHLGPRTKTAGNFRLLFEMLQLKPWCNYPLTVYLLHPVCQQLLSKCPSLPSHMRMEFADWDELKATLLLPACEAENEEDDGEDDADVKSAQVDDTDSTATHQSASVTPSLSTRLKESDTCFMCSKHPDFSSKRSLGIWTSLPCSMKTHLRCLALHFLDEGKTCKLIP